MAFKLPESKDIHKIPKLFREAFESLRSPETDPVGATWALTSLINDKQEEVIAIIQLTYDPKSAEPTGFIPMFIAYPHTGEDIKRYETTHENTSDLLN